MLMATSLMSRQVVANTYTVTTNHLDLVKCWKGLSHTQALELLMWYRFFHACLEIEVQASLCNDLVDGLAFRDGKSGQKVLAQPGSY